MLEIPQLTTKPAIHASHCHFTRSASHIAGSVVNHISYHIISYHISISYQYHINQYHINIISISYTIFNTIYPILSYISASNITGFVVNHIISYHSISYIAGSVANHGISNAVVLEMPHTWPSCATPWFIESIVLPKYLAHNLSLVFTV